MTARQRTSRQPHVVEDADQISLDTLIRRKPQVDALHLNLRLTGDNADIYSYLQKRTPSITDSLRIRDCIRLAAFLMAMKDKETPILVTTPDGSEKEILEFIGAFHPQSGMDTRRRSTR
jgi:hypothetical protein